MKLTPVLSAGFATLYIALVVLFTRFIESVRHDTPDTFLDGIGFMLLFVLSFAVMAVLFFYQPLVLLMEQRKEEAFSHVVKTLLIFGVITIGVAVGVSMQ